MNTSDLALLERWTAHRDAEAFAELVARHSGMVYATCRRILGDAADAEDAAQECFVNLLNLDPAAQTLTPSLGGWLYTVAARRALDRVKAVSRRRVRETLHVAEQTPFFSEDAGAEWDEVQQWLDEAVASLPEKLRQPLVAHFFAGQTHEVIARESGLPRSTVTSRVAKGIEEVRRHLARRGFLMSASVLASLMTAEAAQAAPAGLTAALGRMALIGGANGTPVGTGGAIVKTLAWGGIALGAKKTAFALALAIVAFGMGWLMRMPGSETRDAEPGTPVSAADVRPGRTGADTVLMAHARPARVGAAAGEEALPDPRVSVEAPVTPSTEAAPAVEEQTETGTIEGSVRLEGEAVAGVQIEVIPAEGQSPSAATSGADGTFRLDNVSPGSVRVLAGHRDDSGSFWRASELVWVETGKTSRAEFDLRGGSSLEGNVSVDGQPAEGGTVTVASAVAGGGNDSVTTLIDASGCYRLARVRPGEVHVVVAARRAEGPERRRNVKLDLMPGATLRQDFDLSGGSSIRGEVSGVAYGERLTLAALSGTVDVPERMNMSWLVEAYDAAAGLLRLDYDEDLYVLDGLLPGTYTIVATAGYGTSAEDMATWRVASVNVDVEEGTDAEVNFDMTAESEAASVAFGTLEGLREDESATVIALRGSVDVPMPLTEDFWARLQGNDVASTAKVGADGTFDLRHLQSGTYTLLALARPEGPRDLATVRTATSTVSIQDSNSVSVVLRFN